MGFFNDTKEKVRLLGIAISEESTIEKLLDQINKTETQKETLNGELDTLIKEIDQLKNKIKSKTNQIALLKEELNSKEADEIELENLILSQKQKMQSLVNKYNLLTKEEKTLRKYFGEIQ